MVGVALIGAMLLQAARQGPLPDVVTRSRVDPSRGVDFHAMVVPDTVYVGQQASYQLGVFIDQDTRQRIRRNPEFQPPETRDLLSYDLREQSGGTLSATLGGRPYELHVFRRALFALTPGRYAIPQARLTYSLPQTASFFSREENYTLRSEAVSFVAIEPPGAGRPSDWAGAVGVWRSSARVDTARGRAGEPFVLTLRLEGQGNVTLLPRPRVTVPWASVVSADERVRLDSAPPLLGGWKEFDWLVTPTESGPRRMPPIRYAFFNPRTRRYEVVESQPFDVRVAAGTVAPAVAPPPVPGPSTDIAPAIRPSLGSNALPLFGRTPFAFVIVLLGPLVAFGTWFARRPPRPRPAPTAQQRLASVAVTLDGSEATRAARQAFVDGIRVRTGLDPANFTDPGRLTAALRKIGVSERSAAAVEALLDAFDTACFSDEGTPQPSGAGWVDQAREALRIVDDEACTPRGARGRRRAAAVVGVVMMLVMAHAVAATAAAQSAADAFALGTTAYAGGDYVRAARYFEDAAHAAPGSVAAWQNLGTAAMLARDTGTAVVGWQRALRLDPTDPAVRAQLARVRAPQETGYAYVPPIPEPLAAAIALVVWTLGWGLTARQAWRRRPARRLALITTLVGGAAVVSVFELARHLAASDLAVVTDPAPLRAIPALGAEAGATPMIGEVGRITAREGVWVQLRLDAVRRGWMPADRVRPLARD